MFDFTGLNIESIKLKFVSLIRFSYKKEEKVHDEKTLNLNQQNYGTRIEKIEKQIVLNLPTGLSKPEQQQFISGALEEQLPELKESESAEAQGTSLPPASDVDKRTETFLNDRLNDYTSNRALLLDRGGLFLIYKEREHLSFSEEALIFLLQSSLKHKFPTWFWTFYYREHFENVTPLFQKAYGYPSVMVRCLIVEDFSHFNDTGDEIVKLAETEEDPEVLGFIASLFLEKNDFDRAQRVIANSITRRITPRLTAKIKGKKLDTKVDLGAAERRFLYKEIEGGWPEEKNHALHLLSLSAEESDLPTLEKMLDTVSYAPETELILLCIGRIGKTSKVEFIEKELLETHRLETFLTALHTLVCIGHKSIFPQLLDWLSNVGKVTRRLWWEVDDSKVEEEIQNAILKLLDESTYEQLVAYIVENYNPDKQGDLWGWRHFWVLRESKTNSQIRSLIQKETRLNAYERWGDVFFQCQIEADLSLENKEGLVSLATSSNSFLENLLILRGTYKIITPELAIQRFAPLIEELRDILKARLKAVSEGNHSQEVKEIAQNEFDNFLGENRSFFRIRRKQKRGSRSVLEGDEDKVFDKLSEDIDWFDTLEKEYLKHILQAKTEERNEILLRNFGRPHECIYESIDEVFAKDRDLKALLLPVIDGHPNPLIRLHAIKAALRLGTFEKEELHKKVFFLMIKAREKAKIARNQDDWFADEITYTWSINTLCEFGDPDDFLWIEDEVNREKILARSFNQYTYFHSEEVFLKLLQLSEDLEDDEERDNAMTALKSLDYKWTKKILCIES